MKVFSKNVCSSYAGGSRKSQFLDNDPDFQNMCKKKKNNNNSSFVIFILRTYDLI